MGDSLQPQTPSRHEKSLGLLTTKFVTLLQEAKDGVLDLKAHVNGQKKYQIHLKSSAGPIEVLLVNKDPCSSSPVVLPVPPPDDMLQSLSTPASATSAAVAPTKPAANSTPSPASTCQSPTTSSTTVPPSTTTVSAARAATVLDFPKELSEMFDPKEIMSTDLLEELMSSEVFSPLLRLSPPPGDHDYIYNLDETEGLCDLFDVPIANL
ncbi:hypothetical protein PO909_021628 [Leuciscus waleckii]